MRSVACRILGATPGSYFRLADRRRWRACMLYQRQHCRCKPVGAHHARLSERHGWMAPALQAISAVLRWTVSTVVCSRCPSRDIALQCPDGQWMSSASEVPIGFTTSEGRDVRRSVQAFG
ncbi:MAG: hypothetical protein ACI85V_002555 [bacterium]|jgi:hypothetical protein